jgi:hypothetical protein
LSVRVLVPAAALVTLALSGAAALAAPGHAEPATQRIVVRPVTSAGRPAAGFTAKAERQLTVDCSDGDSSPAAVDDDIALCSPAAAYPAACWKSARRHHVLCLRDARKPMLARIALSGAFAPTTAPKRPVPLDMVLGDGRFCELRIGGAGPTLPHHPRYEATYYCTHGSAVWGKDQRIGINRSHRTWTVRVARTDSKSGKLTTRRVAKAYFVGTHR